MMVDVKFVTIQLCMCGFVCESAVPKKTRGKCQIPGAGVSLIVDLLTWTLGPELGSSGRPASALTMETSP